MSSAKDNYGLTEWLNRQLCYARIEGNDRVAGYCEELLRMVAGGWQPIATAPRDGNCLVACATDDGWMLAVLERDKKGNWIHEGEPTFCHSWYCEPKWWQPLPAPPPAPPAAADTTEGER